MMKMIQSIKAEYQRRLEKIVFSVEVKEMEKYELQLISGVNLLMFILISIISVPLSLKWGISPIKSVIFSMSLLGIAVAIFIISRNKRMTSTQQLHFISILYVISFLITYYVFYLKVKVLFWFTIVIISIFFNMSSRSVLHFYMMGITAILLGVSIIVDPQDVIIVDYSFYFSLAVMLSLVFFSGFIVNRLYKVISETKIREYRQLIDKNDEITSLYEEISATEEELRDQNEKLHLYNDEINANKEKLEYLAYHDPLTQLPNREMIIEQLNILVDSNIDGHLKFSVVFIDLDNFKKVNDSMGHSSGDKLLVEVSKRLQASIHAKDVIGRLGGDELALIIRRHLSEEDLLTYVQEICDVFNDIFMINSVKISISASFGIAMYPVDGSNVEELLKAADTAMYKAKDMGKNNVQFFEKAMKEAILYRIEMEEKLQSALVNEEFYLEYQPLYETKNQKLVSFEALIRWENKDKCRVSPADFIPFAEETGLIIDIGEWVLREACRQINRIADEGIEDILIAVNISAIQMREHDFIDRVRAILNETAVNPHYLEFEITESVFILDKDKVIADIKTLQELGIRIAMDDFGTGYASLSYLMGLPIDILKIDQLFVSAIEQGNDKNEVIRAIIKMAHALNMKVVAEGVETPIQLAYLQAESCDYLQGYLLNRPLDKSKMIQLMLKGE